MNLVITAILLLFLPLTAMGNAKVIGNGGNETALDFANSAKRVLSIYGGELKTYPSLKNKDLRRTLEETSILVSTKPLTVVHDGVHQEVTAVNFRNPSMILINEKRWRAIKQDVLKEALALHELLGLAGVESTGNYFISKNYLVKNGIHCKSGLCESTAIQSPKETFCRFQNNWYPNDQTLKYRFLCKGKTEFTIYCDLWKDPLEFAGNKIDALGGTWLPKDNAGGILNYSYPDVGGKRCTYADVRD